MSNAPSSSNRNVKWAVETFRPLLKSLRLQYLPELPVVVKAKDFRNLIIKGMGRCVIGVQRQEITDGQDGYCTFIHDKKRDIFFISIVINERFFADDSLKARTERKALGIHEFVHCVAIMMSVSSLGSGPNPLIERLKEILREQLSVTTSADFTQLLNALGAIQGNMTPAAPLCNDKHFRTEFEDFPDDYAELYLSFLFSFNLLLEEIDKHDKNSFKESIKNEDTDGITVFLNEVIDGLVTDKALDRNLVIQRLCGFLPQLILYLNHN